MRMRGVIKAGPESHQEHPSAENVDIVGEEKDQRHQAAEADAYPGHLDAARLNATIFDSGSFAYAARLVGGRCNPAPIAGASQTGRMRIDYVRQKTVK